MSQELETSPKANGFKTVLRKWAPWFVTVAVFVYVFYRVPFDKVLDAAVHVNLWIFLPLLLANIAFHFFWNVLIYTLLFRWFGVEVTYRGMMPIKGATYLLVLLNFFAGQGGLALLMNRWKNLSMSRASSIIVFALFVDYYLILAFCLAGAFQLDDVDLVRFFDSGDEGGLVRFVVISWAFFVFHIAFYRWYLPRSKGLTWFKQNQVLAAFREAPLALYLKLGAVKSVNSVIGIVTCYYALTAFGVRVPLLHLIVMLPIVWMIGSVPITVMGLGTVQAAMIWLVARFAEGSGTPEEITAAVVAYSLLWAISGHVAHFAIGAVCVSRLPKNIWMPKKDKQALEC